MSEGSLRALMMAATVAIHLGLALLVGAMASQLWLRGRDSAWRDEVLAQGRNARRSGCALGLAGLLASAWFEAAAMAETPLLQAGQAVEALVLRTHFGHAWTIGLVAWSIAGLLPFAEGSDGRRPVAFAAAIAALSVFIATRSVVSHAGSGGDFTPDVAVDWLHLSLVSLWVGMVMAGARLALPVDDAPLQARADAAYWVQRMSTTATVALVAIAATGLLKAWRAAVPASSVHEFLDSSYGHALGAKLVLVALAVALGGFNRFVVLPGLFRQLAGGQHGGPWRQRLVTILRLEAATLLLVLVAASLLSGTEPPGTS